jgi:hypothetical protein
VVEECALDQAPPLAKLCNNVRGVTFHANTMSLLTDDVFCIIEKRRLYSS